MNLVYRELNWDVYPIQQAGGVVYLQTCFPTRITRSGTVLESGYEIVVPNNYVAVIELDGELYISATVIEGNTHYEKRLDPGKHVLSLPVVMRQDCALNFRDVEAGYQFATLTLFKRNEDNDYVKRADIHLLHYRNVSTGGALASLRSELKTSLERAIDFDNN